MAEMSKLGLEETDGGPPRVISALLYFSPDGSSSIVRGGRRHLLCSPAAT